MSVFIGWAGPCTTGDGVLCPVFTSLNLSLIVMTCKEGPNGRKQSMGPKTIHIYSVP